MSTQLAMNTRFLKIPELVFCGLIATMMAGCAPTDKLDLSTGWKTHVGDDRQFSSVDYDDSAWETIDLPGLLSPKIAQKVIWLRREFSLGDTSDHDDLYLFLGKIWDADETYLNGSEIGRLGRENPDFFSAWNFDRCYKIPRNLLRLDGKNVIAVRVFSNQKPTFNGAPFVSRSRIALNELVWQKAKAQYLPFAMGVLTLFLGVFSLFLFLLDRDNSLALHYSGVSLLWALMSLHFFLPDFGRFYNAMDKAYYALLSVEFCWFYIFLERLFRARVRFARGTMLVLAAIAVLLSVTATDQDPVTGWRSQAIGVAGIVAQMLWGHLLLKGFRQDREVQVVFVSYVIFIICFVHDVLALSFLITYDVFWINLGYPAMIAAFGIVISLRSVENARKLKESTIEIESKNDQLGEALERAEENARVKEEILAKTTHELRTPLNAIINIPDGLLDRFEAVEIVRCKQCQEMFEIEEEDDRNHLGACPSCRSSDSLQIEEIYHFAGEEKDIVDLLKKVSRSGRHLLNVVNDVLDISKLQAGRGELHSEEVVLRGLLDELRVTIEPIASPRNIELVIQELSEDLVLNADPVKLLQIFINLTANAVKFSNDNSQVEIEVLSNEEWVMVSFRDHGIGISEEDRELVFESFKQVHSQATKSKRGTGLGLSISKELVELHGGKIWLESIIGEGTVFYVQLPFQGGDAV